MTELRTLQCRFQDYLTGVSEEIEQDIISTSYALAEHRLGAYYDAYRIRLINALATDFSSLQKYLGNETFEILCLDYLKARPSTHPSVRWFGQHLVEFIRADSELEDREFIAELASFEWTQGLVFDAEDEGDLIRLEDMAQVPPQAWPEIVIQFKPAILWLDLYWNVCPVSVALESNAPSPEKQRSEMPVRWLLWRKNLDTHWRSLEVHEAWAIELAHQGANFAALCEGLCEWISEDQVSLVAASLLKQWINDDLVEKIN